MNQKTSVGYDLLTADPLDRKLIVKLQSELGSSLTSNPFGTGLYKGMIVTCQDTLKSFKWTGSIWKEIKEVTVEEVSNAVIINPHHLRLTDVQFIGSLSSKINRDLTISELVTLMLTPRKFPTIRFESLSDEEWTSIKKPTIRWTVEVPDTGETWAVNFSNNMGLSTEHISSSKSYTFTPNKLSNLSKESYSVYTEGGSMSLVVETSSHVIVSSSGISASSTKIPWKGKSITVTVPNQETKIYYPDYLSGPISIRDRNGFEYEMIKSTHPNALGNQGYFSLSLPNAISEPLALTITYL